MQNPPRSLFARRRRALRRLASSLDYHLRTAFQLPRDPRFKKADFYSRRTCLQYLTILTELREPGTPTTISSASTRQETAVQLLLSSGDGGSDGTWRRR
jgi:hypothetical protein